MVNLYLGFFMSQTMVRSYSWQILKSPTSKIAVVSSAPSTSALLASQGNRQANETTKSANKKFPPPHFPALNHHPKKSQIYSFHSGCFFLDHSRFENEVSKSYHSFCIIYYRVKIKL